VHSIGVRVRYRVEECRHKGSHCPWRKRWSPWRTLGYLAFLLSLDLGEHVTDIRLLDELVLVSESATQTYGQLAEVELGLAMHDEQPS
jgi:hypothetical protein